MLTVDGISKQFGPTRALDRVSVTVRHGEVLGLIGPNGSGKSTLFECIAGLLAADTGTVRRGTTTVAPAERKHALFYVPDGVAPWPDQTVAWTLAFTAHLHGAASAKHEQLIEALALGGVLAQRTGTLSKGQRKRLLLALGLLTPQPLLLLDEPFDGLDLRQTRDVIALLRRERAAGRTLFLSIHQLGDAVRVCDRIVLLSGGRVVGEGTLDELRARAGVAEGGLDEVFLALT